MFLLIFSLLSCISLSYTVIANPSSGSKTQQKIILKRFELGHDAPGGGIVSVHESRKTTPFCCRRLPHTYLVTPSYFYIKFNICITEEALNLCFEFINKRINEIHKSKRYNAKVKSCICKGKMEFRFKALLEYEEVQALIEKANNMLNCIDLVSKQDEKTNHSPITNYNTSSRPEPLYQASTINCYNQMINIQ